MERVLTFHRMKKLTTMGSTSLKLLFSSNPKPIASSDSYSDSDSYSESDSSEEAQTQKIPEKPTNPFPLTPLDLARIKLLIPRLCASNHHSTAVDLAATALLLGNPISLSTLIKSLTSQPDIGHTMSLLTRLKYSPTAHAYLSPITTALISSYLKNNYPRHALEVYDWMAKPASPCPPGPEVSRALVIGFCRGGMVLEGLRVLRDMVAAGFEVGGDLRKRVCGGLLREAMILEARELEEAFASVGDGGGRNGFEKVLELVDRIIADWDQ